MVQTGWSLCSVMSDGNSLISVIYIIEKGPCPQMTLLCFMKPQHCLCLHSWVLEIDV